MAATLWDSFDNLLEEAENHFLNFRRDEAMKAWDSYYNITARQEYQTIGEEVKQNWDEARFVNVGSLSQLYIILLDMQNKRTEKQISRYTFDLYKKLIIRIYNSHFKSLVTDTSGLESGIFDYLCGNYQVAIDKLSKILEDDIENLQARIYLGYAFMDSHEQKSAISILSENLFLAADQFPEEALYLSQFKLLFGKLYSEHGSKKEAAWLLTFESWYRNYLIFTENKRFFRLMQQKESNERILQVKYYSHERYRHFIRCLFVADYTRQFHKENRGLIQEQENYMQKLDRELFARYRKKRPEPA